MCILEDMLQDLFEAKDEGLKDTLSMKLFIAWKNPSPTVSINDSIRR